MESDPADYRTLKRIEIPGKSRFLTFTCFQNRRFLNSDRTRQWLVEAIDLARGLHMFSLWAWVIMPEHAHLLIFPRHADPRVGPILSTVKSSVSKRALHWVKQNAPAHLGKMADKDPSGRVVRRFWQRGAGYDRSVRTSRGVWNIINYIHRNPVERGLCARPEDWEWSSARAFRDPDAGPLKLDLEKVPWRRD